MEKKLFYKNVKELSLQRNSGKSEKKRHQDKIVETAQELFIVANNENVANDKNENSACSLSQCKYGSQIIGSAKGEDKCLLSNEESQASHEWEKDKSENSENLSIEALVRKDSPINPYNRAEYPPVQWLPPDVDEDTVVAIPGLERETFLKAHMFSCSCSSQESLKKENGHFSSIRTDEECCSEDLARKHIYRTIRDKVEKAVKKHKVFLIRGELPKLKEALENRGWIQKYESSKTRSLPYGSVPCVETKSLGDIQQADGELNEKALVFAMLRHKAPDFIWDCRNNFVDWDCNLKSSTILNRLQKPATYTSKLGMASVLQNSLWLYEEDVADVNFPRSYNLSRELTAFIKDFRRTAAAGLLRWFVLSVEDREEDKDWDTIAVDIGQVEFARKRCQEYIADMKHENIDHPDPDVSEDEWNRFCDDYNSLLHKVSEIPSNTSIQSGFKETYEAAVSVLKELKEIDCQYNLNGTRNVWILKPSHLCCGFGISISHNLKEILRRAEMKPNDYFIVQKYIEHPLLVQGTKFDIRLWYLVTSSFPLTIWIFKEALLRFSSKPYSFSSYHEAIHICNTAIQVKYDYERRRRRKRGDVIENTETVRDQGWDCEKLNECLKNMGYEGEPFYDTIYPRMSQAIVMTMLTAQESMDKRRCSFELYGADFMVMEDLSVWLIEINTNPRMHPPSSKITQRLYDSVLDSLVKVILDLPLNPSADTGEFVLAYKQSVPEFRPYLGPCLFAVGKAIKLHECPEKKRDESRAIVCSSWSKQNRARTAPPRVARSRDLQVVDFIDYLNSTSSGATNETLTRYPNI